jgi:hypothetical protein
LPALTSLAGTIDLKINIGCLRVPPAPAIPFSARKNNVR